MFAQVVSAPVVRNRRSRLPASATPAIGCVTSRYRSYKPRRLAPQAAIARDDNGCRRLLADGASPELHRCPAVVYASERAYRAIPILSVTRTSATASRHGRRALHRVNDMNRSRQDPCPFQFLRRVRSGVGRLRRRFGRCCRFGHRDGCERHFERLGQQRRRFRVRQDERAQRRGGRGRRRCAGQRKQPLLGHRDAGRAVRCRRQVDQQELHRQQHLQQRGVRQRPPTAASSRPASSPPRRPRRWRTKGQRSPSPGRRSSSSAPAAPG